MLFKEIPGQEKHKLQFTQAAIRSRIPHALLISGHPGIGSLGFALAIAQWILCEGDKDTEACGNCRACLKMEKLSHPDFHISFPFFGSKVTSGLFVNQWREAVVDNPFMYVRDWMRQIGGESKNPNINVLECNKIIRDLSLKTFESNSKVYVIWLAEFLGKQGNRLLKLIEEPTANTHLILVTEQIDRILPTIVSRCQLIKLDRLDEGVISTYLQDTKGIASEDAGAASMIVDGDMNLAITLVKEPDQAIPEAWFQWISSVSRRSFADMIKQSEMLAKLSKEHQLRFLDFGSHFLGEMSRYMLSNMEIRRLQDKNRKLAARMSAIANIPFLEELMELLDSEKRNLQRNVNSRISFMGLTIRVSHLFAELLKNKAQTVR